MKKKILITGCAGFIGSQFALRSLKKYDVIGIDNFDNYYSVSFKKKRVSILQKKKNFKFYKVDIRDFARLNNVIKKYKINYVFHFAAQAGVRYSKINPEKYTTTNIIGTINLLNSLKSKKVDKIFLSSSSSVYGENKKFPLNEKEKLSPINHYAFTKQVNELTGEIFSKNYNQRIYMLRFFTVYGKWGRPDMFFFKLFKSVFEKKYFKLNNNGNHDRDFTHIDDVCEILIKLMNQKINRKFGVFNICSNNPVNIKKIINYLKKKVNVKLKIKNTSRNKLDVKKTHGSNIKVLNLVGSKKFKRYEESIKDIFDWYKSNKIYKF
tara:strand:- start:36398 stop:37363 length:966 start_codon:yes stop_codon:yes gene_type:complete